MDYNEIMDRLNQCLGLEKPATEGISQHRKSSSRINSRRIASEAFGGGMSNTDYLLSLGGVNPKSFHSEQKFGRGYSDDMTDNEIWSAMDDEIAREEMGDLPEDVPADEAMKPKYQTDNPRNQKNGKRGRDWSTSGFAMLDREKMAGLGGTAFYEDIVGVYNTPDGELHVIAEAGEDGYSVLIDVFDDPQERGVETKIDAAYFKTLKEAERYLYQTEKGRVKKNSDLLAKWKSVGAGESLEDENGVRATETKDSHCYAGEGRGRTCHSLPHMDVRGKNNRPSEDSAPSFESQTIDFKAKMLARYKELAQGATALESYGNTGKSNLAIIRKVSCEFGYDWKRLQDLVEKALKEGII